MWLNTFSGDSPLQSRSMQALLHCVCCLHQPSGAAIRKDSVLFEDKHGTHFCTAQLARNHQQPRTLVHVESLATAGTRAMRNSEQSLAAV
jgi:hypothetical protein